ncbi:MAG: hypothetical protein U1C49_03150 [Candidatus Andersenbacteria bacterium]|nr:hypothetical protein [bacterium]MDZ4225823.1 hypothetical protein [Candidatus Andersenbacteria bacterium]
MGINIRLLEGDNGDIREQLVVCQGSARFDDLGIAIDAPEDRLVAFKRQFPDRYLVWRVDWTSTAKSRRLVLVAAPEMIYNESEEESKSCSLGSQAMYPLEGYAERADGSKDGFAVQLMLGWRHHSPKRFRRQWVHTAFTSRHSHPVNAGVVIHECFHPVWGQVELWQPEGGWQTLTRAERVNAGTPHCLRSNEGIVLLQMSNIPPGCAIRTVPHRPFKPWQSS